MDQPGRQFPRTAILAVAAGSVIVAVSGAPGDPSENLGEEGTDSVVVAAVGSAPGNFSGNLRSEEGDESVGLVDTVSSPSRSGDLESKQTTENGFDCSNGASGAVFVTPRPDASGYPTPEEAARRELDSLSFLVDDVDSFEISEFKSGLFTGTAPDVHLVINVLQLPSGGHLATSVNYCYTGPEVVNNIDAVGSGDGR